MSERDTEALIRPRLHDAGYDKITEQRAPLTLADELLGDASKSGRGHRGSHEFVALLPGREDVIVVVECKARVADHGGGPLYRDATTDNPVGKAVDGVLHYSDFLAKGYTVVGVAASGETEDALTISFYVQRKGEKAVPLTKTDGTYFTDIPRPDVLARVIDREDSPSSAGRDALREVAVGIHEFMRNYGSLKQETKPLLVAGSLIALSDRSFKKSYKDTDEAGGDRIGKHWVEAIEDALGAADLPSGKTAQVVSVFRSAVDHSPALMDRNRTVKRGKVETVDSRSVLAAIVERLEDSVFPEIRHDQGYDVIGDFYGEFLKYATGDGKDLGIVLTPPHITELFAHIGGVNKSSVVLDTCTGTGGFLIAAMEHMTRPVQGVALTDEELDSVKKHQLIGIEFQPSMYALAGANMLLRGDGKSNLFLSSCFDEATGRAIVSGEREGFPDPIRRPNVGLINPPYAQGKNSSDLSEGSFILRMLDLLEPGGTGIAIVPMSVATGQNAWRKKILERHTLEASMTMPPELFYGVGTQTVILVFTAHRPHNEHHRTWFARWTDDGHITLRGRKDLHGKWPSVRDQWTTDFLSRKQDTPGYCVSKHVDETDEWLVEAHMETDYSSLTDHDFTKVLREFAIYQATKEAV